MNFPNTLTGKTRVARKSTVRASRAVDGTLRYIDTGAAAWSQLDGVVEALTGAERDTLIAWLIANETADVDYNVGTITYRGKLNPESDIVWEVQGGSLFEVRFSAWVKAI